MSPGKKCQYWIENACRRYSKTHSLPYWMRDHKNLNQNEDDKKAYG